MDIGCRVHFYQGCRLSIVGSIYLKCSSLMGGRLKKKPLLVNTNRGLAENCTKPYGRHLRSLVDKSTLLRLPIVATSFISEVYKMIKPTQAGTVIQFPAKKPSKAKRQPFVIASQADFKAWVLQEPNAAKLLKHILFRWRGASAQVRGEAGPWVAYLLDKWSEWLGMSRDQLKRALPILVTDGLILRQRHRFAGIKNTPFYQPTKLAILYAGKPSDFDHLAKVRAPQRAPQSAPVHAPSDYTSLPLNLESPIKSLKKPSSIEIEKEKIKPHEQKIGKNNKYQPMIAEMADMSEDDITMLEKLKTIKSDKELTSTQKRIALLELLPVVSGAKSLGVEHPSSLHKNWHGWSPELHITRYAVYVEYAENALGKTTAKKKQLKYDDHGIDGYHAPVGVDPEHDALMAQMDIELAASFAALEWD